MKCWKPREHEMNIEELGGSQAAEQLVGGLMQRIENFCSPEESEAIVGSLDSPEAARALQEC